MPPATVLSWWRGHPAGWWNPADYNVASICVPIGDARAARGRARVGEAPEGRERGRDRLLRRRRHLGGRVPRGRELRRRDAGAARPLLQQQPAGRSRRRLEAQTARRDARRQGGRLRDARACASTAATCSPCTRRRARRPSGRAPATARRSSRRSPTARRRTRPRTTRARTSTPSASRRSAKRECVGPLRGLPAAARACSPRRTRIRSAPRPRS